MQLGNFNSTLTDKLTATVIKCEVCDVYTEVQ